MHSVSSAALTSLRAPVASCALSCAFSESSCSGVTGPRSPTLRTAPTALPQLCHLLCCFTRSTVSGPLVTLTGCRSLCHSTGCHSSCHSPTATPSRACVVPGSSGCAFCAAVENMPLRLRVRTLESTGGGAEGLGSYRGARGVSSSSEKSASNLKIIRSHAAVQRALLTRCRRSSRQLLVGSHLSLSLSLCWLCETDNLACARLSFPLPYLRARKCHTELRSDVSVSSCSRQQVVSISARVGEPVSVATA